MKAVSSGTEEERGVSRATVVALLACGLFAPLGLFSPGLVLPQIEREFASVPNAALLAQLVGALASFAFALGAPIAGALVARVGCRSVVVPALVVFAVVGAAPAWLDDLHVILATRAMLGLALAGIFTGALTGIGALPGATRARMFGLFSLVGGATAVVMFPVVGALARSGWHQAFLIQFVALLAVPLALRLPPSMGRASRASAVGMHERARSSVLNPAMLGLLVLAALAGMSMYIAPMYSPLYLNSLGMSDPQRLAIPVTLGAIGAVFASALYGPMHHRLGVQGVSAAMMALMAVALLVAGTVQSIFAFTVAIVVQSATLAVLAPNVSASAVAFSPPEKAAQAIGLGNGVMFGSQLLFPFLAGAVRAAMGLQGVFLVFGAAAASVAVYIVVRSRMW